MPLPWLQAAWPETVCAMTRTYAVPSTCELTESLLRLALDFIRRGPTAWCNSHGRFAKALMAKLLDSLSLERGWDGRASFCCEGCWLPLTATGLILLAFSTFWPSGCAANGRIHPLACLH